MKVDFETLIQQYRSAGVSALWSGKLVCLGMGGEINIERDEYGIPHIHAHSALDAWFGLGFCQGQDRAFQLDMLKRKTRGTLSEVFGKDTLPADRLARTIGFHRLALAFIQEQDQTVRDQLSAFCEGVNSGTASGVNHKALEFELLEYEPSTFEPVDVIAHQLLLSFALSHWVPKITRWKMMEQGSAETLLKLDPDYAAWNYLISPVGQKAGAGADLLRQEIQAAQDIFKLKGISNNWVIGGQLTRSGQPIVANDPHLNAEVPALWYLADLICPDFELSGACFAGSPLFLAGFNQHVSWGITAAFIDNIDLFIEQLSTAGRSVRRGNDFIPCQVLEEKINVRGEPTQTFNVTLTDRGPLLSSLNTASLPHFSFCATWNHPGKIAGFFEIAQARDVEHIRALFKDWPLFSLNLVCADDRKNFAWILAGETPLRKKTRGMLPMPGWDAAYGWEETRVPYEQYPTSHNPASGFIATANNKPVKDSEALYFGRDYIDGYRQARIVELIQSAVIPLTIESVSAMQLDVLSSVWLQIRSTILAHDPQQDACAKSLELLRGWDGVVSADSRVATVFEHFIALYLRALEADAAGTLQEWVNAPYVQGVTASCFAMSRISQAVGLINAQPADWFGGQHARVLETCLASAWNTLFNELGAPSEAWQWGTYRRLELFHIGSQIGSEQQKQSFAKIFNLGPVPWGGDEQCVNVAAGDIYNPCVQPNFIPNLRMVVEAGNADNNYFALAGGNSGDPFSPYYANLFKLWAKGEGISLKHGRVDAAFQLSLLPDKSLKS